MRFCRDFSEFLTILRRFERILLGNFEGILRINWEFSGFLKGFTGFSVIFRWDSWIFSGFFGIFDNCKEFFKDFLGF